jgi:hypothetical protein
VVPRKLVEIAFRRLWILLVPVVFVPVAVVALQDNPPATNRRQSSGWRIRLVGSRPLACTTRTSHRQPTR